MTHRWRIALPLGGIIGMALAIPIDSAHATSGESARLAPPFALTTATVKVCGKAMTLTLAAKDPFLARAEKGTAAAKTMAPPYPEWDTWECQWYGFATLAAWYYYVQVYPQYQDALTVWLHCVDQALSSGGNPDVICAEVKQRYDQWHQQLQWAEIMFFITVFVGGILCGLSAWGWF